MKKVISIILCLTMMFSFCLEFNSVSYAYGFYDLSLTQQADIKDVIDMGIMKGDEKGYFNPNSYLTKAEAATIVCRMIGEKNTYLSTVSKFKDVPFSHWASQTISVASSKGLVLGDGNNFYPNKKLTSMELITMCLRVLGVGKALDATGAWPRAHINFVNDQQILEGVTATDYYVTRIEAAKIISQFLAAKTWEVNTATGIYEQTEYSVLEKYLGAASYKNVIITSIDSSRYRIEGVYADRNGNYTEELPYTYLSSDLDTDELVPGAIVDISVKGGSIIKLDIKSDNDSRYINFDGVVDFNTSTDYIKVRINGKTQKYNLSDDLLIVNASGKTEVGSYNNMSRAKRLVSNELKEYYNMYVESHDTKIDFSKTYYKDENGEREVDLDIYDSEDDASPYSKSWYEEATDADYDENEITGTLVLDGDSHVISIGLSVYKKIMYVKSVSSTKLTGQTGLSISSENRLTSLSLSRKDTIVKDIDGKTLDIDDLEKNDIILISDTSEDTIYILKLDETIYGYVEGKDLDDGWIQLDGEDYYLNKRYCNSVPSVSSRTKRTLYLDQNGRVVA
ncbi:MAG: S-layer homology domain-containing protein [Clostridia bacterium]|nr:S-layer homology domain-containing protein [Clostridia bacterium]